MIYLLVDTIFGSLTINVTVRFCAAWGGYAGEEDVGDKDVEGPEKAIVMGRSYEPDDEAEAGEEDEELSER